ncbi:Acyl-CoA synthetase (AMP-forming)/AMP-acid ligase II [Actinopolyspora mzabensis]|uniref:Acyl-CoA synthetase (AMP-forming)/AMP-acid ligase II n=1 Tax=Actinopolyspora mzabensis TaxID=995066 RepID=A0A1G9FN36_ACTMZ|nr:AMP-binding protein [Actinopolyspora mzabensis]SDK89804.1 Acyl-CoA synthetase (AMP-forming)/AMP-acid ligase II [Actinopolyspora mzabensis]
MKSSTPPPPRNHPASSEPSPALALPPILAGGTPRTVRSPNGEFTGTELVRRAHAAASELATAGAGPNSRVFVEAERDPTIGLARLLGADLLGSATLLADPEWSDTERAGVLREAAPDVFASGPLPGPADPIPPDGDGARLFYLPTTSGSTGRARVLARTRRSWWYSFESFDVGITARDTVLIPGPPSSSLFLFGALHAMHLGCDVELSERWSAARAAEACTRATAVHLVPTMLTALLAVLEREPRLLAACRVRRFVCGGAEPDEGLRRRLGNLLPDCELVEYYGSAEHSVVALRGADELLHPAEHVEVRIGAPAGTASDGTEPGTLWVRSPLHFSGFLESGVLRAVEPGFHSVGDLARGSHRDGFRVLGRGSATIETGGRLVAAEEVENVLRTAPGVFDVVVAPTPHPRFGALVTAVVEPESEHAVDLARLRRLARDSLGSAQRPRRWVSVNELPRTPSGKPARGAVREWLATGELPTEVPG